VHREKAELWRRLNDLKSARPLVCVNPELECPLAWKARSFVGVLISDITTFRPTCRSAKEALE
jgi:hypothetical protein